MSAQSTTGKTDSKQGDKRRSERVVLSVPIEVGWTTKEGKKVKEAAESEIVNAHGAMIRIKNRPSASQVDLSHSKSSGAVRARVVKVIDPEGGEYTRLAVEFASPNEEFWGVGYLLQKSTADLKQLVQTLESDQGEIDSRILTDFRDIVNQVRRISWVVQQWVNLQAKGRDPYAVLTMLAAERVRLMTNLGQNLSTDLDATEISFETEGLEDLFHAVQGLHIRLSYLFRKD